MTIIHQWSDSVDPFDDGAAEALGNQQMYGVIRGCAVTLDASDMTWDIATGDVMHNGIPVAVAAQTNVTTVTADASNDRWVRMRVNGSGTASAVEGTAAASPTKPDLGDFVEVHAVLVDANLTILANAAQSIVKRLPVRWMGYKGTDIIAASTINFPADGGDFFDITGATTITAIQDAAEGTTVKFQFDAVLTITHNATSLKMVDGNDFITQAGDYLWFTSEGGGNWHESMRNPVTTAEFQVLPRVVAAVASSRLQVVPVWKDTTGIIDHCVMVTGTTTTNVHVAELRRIGNLWVHDGTLARDATVTLGVTATAITNITCFAIDSPGTSSNRILFVATNDVAQTPDTFEMFSIDLTDAETLTATAVTITGANQPTDTNTMSTASCALSTTSVATIFEDDGHTAVLSGDETGFTLTYTAAKVSAIDTSISVTGTAGVTYSMYLIGTQLVLYRNDAAGITGQALWEMSTTFALTDEFLDVGLGPGQLGTHSNALFAISGSFAISTMVGSTAPSSPITAGIFPLDSLVTNS